jgi:ribonuclease HI
VEVVVVDAMMEGIDFIMGMDVIYQLGGVNLSRRGVTFGCEREAGRDLAVAVAETVAVTESKIDGMPTMKIEDRDFSARFDGLRWEVEWRWKGEPPELKNKKSWYHSDMSNDTWKKFENELDSWIEKDILRKTEPVTSGIIPLMAVLQPAKGKVRPVFDFRELNEYTLCHTGDEIAVCDEKLREWRRGSTNLKIVDLKAAYLQLGVSEHLWKYQIVKYKGQFYSLTRLGFGLNSAPRIMMRILREVLSKDERIERATSHYIDDIMVNEDVASAEEVVAHLARFGLEAKTPEALAGGRVLGLRLNECQSGELIFSRGNTLPESIDVGITRRQLFSLCGKLVGHYPIVGWLRLACSYIKRLAEGYMWDDPIGEKAEEIVRELLECVRMRDPVAGTWSVQQTMKGIIWCDASNMGMGVILEIDGAIVEDAAWLRKKSDHAHINVAELEAVMKGINLCIKWGLRTIHVKTDSATVRGWIHSTVTVENRIKTKGSAEMLVKRRLSNLRQLIEEFELVVSVELVRSEKNKADALTRVRKSWLVRHPEEEEEGYVCAISPERMKYLHGRHHQGVEKSLSLARMIDPGVRREDVEKIVKLCVPCQSIDPAPARHEEGSLGVSDNWARLAIDVTHFKGASYLSLVDCGPGRFAIWKKLKNEGAYNIVDKLQEVFCERGPVKELLMDNATAFRSEPMKTFCKKWNVHQRFRAAYRASGNAIVERNHRTIKRMAEKCGIDPVEAVFWYNLSPRQHGLVAPCQEIFKYGWRHPDIPADEPVEVDQCAFNIGDRVWVKPPNCKCTSRWNKGRISEIISSNNVMVDGMPRHVLDVRAVIGDDPSTYGDV